MGSANHKVETTSRFSTRDMAMIGLMTAVTCVVAPLSLPIGPVPISLTTLVLYFSVYLIGTKQAFISCLIYLLLGMVGLPVFSGFSGGAAKLAGPTGGYLLGYLLMILIAGFFITRANGKKWIDLMGMILGTEALYTLGTVWLSVQSGIGLKAALFAGVIPFIPGDAVKILLALFQGRKIRNLLLRVRK